MAATCVVLSRGRFRRNKTQEHWRRTLTRRFAWSSRKSSRTLPTWRDRTPSRLRARCSLPKPRAGWKRETPRVSSAAFWLRRSREMSERLSAVCTSGKTMTAGYFIVTPAKAGVQGERCRWNPVYTRMTALGPHSFHGNGGAGSVVCFNAAVPRPATNEPRCFRSEDPCGTLRKQSNVARSTRFLLTPALFPGRGSHFACQPGSCKGLLEGEGTVEPPSCRAGSLGVVVQHLAELLFGHAGRAQQYQNDFRLQGFGLGERRTRSLADTRVDGRRVRDPHHRHSLALGKIGGDPGGEQPAKLRQRLLHRFAVRHAVVEGNRYDTDPPLPLPGNGRQSIRGISDVNGDG